MKGNIFRAAFAAVVWTILGAAELTAQGTAPSPPADDAALSGAICAIVYPVEQISSAKGFHYLFYGNGFFINDQGYLITAAHVLGQLHGGEPHILPQPIAGPPKILPAVLIAADREHDVAGSVEDRTSGDVFAFAFSRLEKQSSETELFLFNHQVRRGQSGAPVISPESHARWG